jgi:hypothetical protein
MSGDHNAHQKPRSYLDRDTIIRLAHAANFEGFGNGDWVCTTEEIERFCRPCCSPRTRGLREDA